MSNKAAVTLGRLGGLVGGKSKSWAKAQAARKNGKKGGRPVKAPGGSRALLSRRACGQRRASVGQPGETSGAVALAELRAFIEQSTWTFAKSMPTTPHEYTLRRNAADEHLFERMVMHIRYQGYRRCFGKTLYWYLDLDGWQYWTMGAPLSRTILINRAKLSGEWKMG